MRSREKYYRCKEIVYDITGWKVPQTDYGEARAEGRRRAVGDAQGGSSTGSGRNAVINDLYRDTAGNRGTVGGVTTNI